MIHGYYDITFIPRLHDTTGLTTGCMHDTTGCHDNRLYGVYKHLTGCQTGLTTGLITG